MSYLRALDASQRALAARIRRAVPSARVHWRYSVVLNGLAVVVPRGQVDRLGHVRGVARVWPSVAYRRLLDRGPKLIGADQLWGPTFTTAGNGLKIAIIDDGVDQSHPFFSPAGYVMPPGYPKGDTPYTTAKVIAARAFSPANNTWKYGTRPFDPEMSEHGTHVAGIAAGNVTPMPIPGRGTFSGVAPKAYLGNYKVLTYPTEDFGLNGNSPEIAAGIEAAVRDGMDVINLSLGEAEIAPSRDLVVVAINAAADAGVAPTIAAGNDFEEYGRGSVSSPGSAAKAITAAAVTKRIAVASFSSSGPTPISLLMKPDVSAPGADITSSVPARDGSWATFSGTSMAAPHVAGAVALIRQRHPEWTVAQLKSALVLTGTAVRPATEEASEVSTAREGGGLVNLPAALNPFVFAVPSSLSFGFVRPGTTATQGIDLADAGGGAGTWTAAAVLQTVAGGILVSVPPTVTVPGRLDVTVTSAPDAVEHEVTGFVFLTRGPDVRRIPFWLRAATAQLRNAPRGTLARTGTYTGNVKGTSAASTYRYPEATPGVPAEYTGPEQIFRVTLARNVANFGVAITSQKPGVRVTPRIVFAGDEDHLVGNAALAISINPYLPTFQQPAPVSAAVRPEPGAYDVVFDTRSPAGAGGFTFRFWIDDTKPPTAQLVARTIARGKPLVVTLGDAGSGVAPESITAAVDGRSADTRYDAKTGRLRILVGLVARGPHRLELSVSDYQESKNMENVPLILPNTRVVKTSFNVR